MAISKLSSERPARGRNYPGLIAGALALILGLLFCRSFKPDEVVFSNDGPLGGLVASVNKMPDVLTGAWHDLNWIGTQSPTPAINVTSMLRLAAGPVIFSKVFAPFSLFILGLGAWAFFRQLKLAPLACVLGGLGAALSSHFLSTACWGVASQVIAVGADFFALALLADYRSRRQWIKTILAGLLVGVNIMEGYDIGAIFSLFVAAFVIFQAWTGEEDTAPKKVMRGVIRVALVAGFAAFLASEALITLIGTQIQGVAGTDQSQQTKAERWDWATQWSFPKGEVLRVVIPGLFGYRMDTPKDMAAMPEWYEGGQYWGKVGETPGWAEHHDDPTWARAHSNGWARFSGGGEYAGLLVVGVALWAVLQAARKKDSIYTLTQRRFIWFWSGAAFVSLLLAFGRYAPFYQFFYSLPYFSTIRNPAKFTHPFHWSLVILFAYGIHGLSRRYLETSVTAGNGLVTYLKGWWAKAERFERKWTMGTLITIVASLLGWLVYASSRASLEKRLQDSGFPDAAMAAQIAGFSIKEVGWFVLTLLVTAALLILVISGRFAGRRARLGGVLLGLLLVIDLARADLPWIIYQDYKLKYATNPVIDLLRERPYEHRVAILPFRAPPQLGMLDQMYRLEWAQHHFLFYDIQSLDLIQMPRVPVDMAAFEGALGYDGTSNTLHRVTRRWQLTNTRYLLGAAGFLDVLNQQIDPEQHRFRIAQRFDLVPKPEIPNPTKLEELTAVVKPDGQYALFEFTGALPRAKLYTNWQVNTNDHAMLQQLAAPSFNPQETVLLAEPPPGMVAATNVPAGTVEVRSYAPKKVVIHAVAKAPSVLLLNDKFDPNWRVSVDGKPAKLLRSNYIMQGVAVGEGDHEITFRFVTSISGLYVSLAAIVLGLGLAGFLAFSRPEEEEGVEVAAQKTGPVEESKKQG